MITDPEEDYARGFVPFLGATVYLDSRPLIPRAETEYWVEHAIAEMLDVGHQALRVLDLFAGSGAIGLAVLKHIPEAHVTFAEKEARHFPTIQKSLQNNWPTSDVAILTSDVKIAERTAFIRTDVWTPMADVRRRPLGRFDYVLANPPYISKERATVEGSVLATEPHEALFAGEDGFALIRRFVEGLPEHLAIEGTAWVEHEPFHTQRIASLAREHVLVADICTDQYGTARYSVIRRG